MIRCSLPENVHDTLNTKTTIIYCYHSILFLILTLHFWHKNPSVCQNYTKVYNITIVIVYDFPLTPNCSIKKHHPKLHVYHICQVFVILFGTPCAQACYKQFIIGKFVFPVRHKHTISRPDIIEMSSLCLYPEKQRCVYLDLFDLHMTCIHVCTVTRWHALLQLAPRLLVTFGQTIWCDYIIGIRTYCLTP